MSIAERSKVWFAVVNVYAASKTASGLWEKAEARLKEKGIVYHGNRTGRSGNAMEITYDACMAGYRKFVAVGGDGTVHDVLNGIAAYVESMKEYSSGLTFDDFTLGVIPLGSGNDWIKSIGVPKDIYAAVDLLADPKLGKQDVVRASVLDHMMRPMSDSYMVNVGGIGIDARVCVYVNAQKKAGKRGKILYVTSLIRAIKERKPAVAKVEVDGRTVFEGPYYSMALGVGKYSGGGMRQTPAAVMDDGMVDLTIIPELPLKRIVREVWKLFTDSFLTVPEVISVKGKSVVVTPVAGSSEEPVEVDGEVVGKISAQFDVLDTQINVVTGK